MSAAAVSPMLPRKNSRKTTTKRKGRKTAQADRGLEREVIGVRASIDFDPYSLVGIDLIPPKPT